jgi:hypothetical protein
VIRSSRLRAGRPKFFCFFDISSGDIRGFHPCNPCHPESARRSLVVVVKCKELTMITGRESCSCVQGVAGRPAALKLGKAKARAVASANSVQPRYTK